MSIPYIEKVKIIRFRGKITEVELYEKGEKDPTVKVPCIAVSYEANAHDLGTVGLFLHGTRVVFEDEEEQPTQVMDVIDRVGDPMFA